MENIILVIHLILALCLIAVVLLQRSEGGGLGMGSGGGGGGLVSARAAANALSKTTWILAIGFLITSLTLTVLSAEKSSKASVIDRVNTEEIESQVEQAPVLPLTPGSDSLTPPTAE